MREREKRKKYTSSAARRHLSSVTSSRVPCTSIRSNAWLSTWMAGSKIAFTSASLLALPVMKLTMWRAFEGSDILSCLFSSLSVSWEGGYYFFSWSLSEVET